MLQLPRFKALDIVALRFLIVGVANTLLGLLIIYLGKWLVGLDDVAANMVGYACGFLLGFCLNKSWSFRYDGAFTPALFRLVIVTIVAYCCNLAVTWIAINSFHVNSYLAQALGVAPYTIINYLGSRYFVFVKSPRVGNDNADSACRTHEVSFTDGDGSSRRV
jgi:putative flippase GtrA